MWTSPLPLHLYLQIRLMRSRDLLQSGGDMVAVEIAGGSQFGDNQQMLAYLRTGHQGTADTLAIKAAETHLIKQAGFVDIDATAEILRMEIRKTAR